MNEVKEFKGHCLEDVQSIEEIEKIEIDENSEILLSMSIDGKEIFNEIRNRFRKVY